MGVAPSLGYDQGMDDPAPIDPETLTALKAYAAVARRPTARPWTVAELLMLLDLTTPVTAIMDRLDVPRPVVSRELRRLRRAGFPVPDRPRGWTRSPRTDAIEADLRDGMSDAGAARRHGVTPGRVWEIRNRAGIPASDRALWTDDERALVIALQDRPSKEVGAMLGRTSVAVDRQRRRLIRQGRIRPKAGPPKRQNDAGKTAQNGGTALT